MSFLTDHIVRIVDAYTGHPPLAAYLRSYFTAYPKLGSRDRRALSEAAFLYYRCRSSYPSGYSIMQVVTHGYILCNSTNVFLGKMLGEPLVQAKQNFAAPVPATSIQAVLSPGMLKEEWLRSMLQQPQLFIRIRKNKSSILKTLEDHNIIYSFVPIPGNNDDDCLMLPNGAAIDKLLTEDDYVVQDWASQASMYLLMQHAGQPAKVWDVCSGAGGKSILLKDKLPPFRLLATDIRDSILHNLKMRFRVYGLTQVKTLVVNSAEPSSVAEQVGQQQFDLVLCDVPCSGSGTWARTPEQFHFFKDRDLEKFEALQYPIAYNASRHVTPGGILAYVTCSVFQAENEAVVTQLLRNADLELIHQQVINGIPHKADSMFAAFFKKP